MLPPNRKLKKLGEISDFQGGSQPEKKYFSYIHKEGYVRFLQIRDFSSDKNITYIPISPKNRLCNKEDILIGRYGASVGKILSGKEGAYNVAIIKTIPDLGKINKDFFYYYLISNLFQFPLLKAGDRAAQAGFSKENIINFLVPLPPLPLQHKIVALLDEASAQITASKSAIQSQLDALDQLWQSSLSEVFENEEYELVKLSSIIEKNSQINPLNNPQDVFTYIDISSIDKEIQKITNPNSFIGKDAPSRAKKHIQQGDIVFATTRPNLKNIAIIENDYENLVASTGFCVLRPTKKVIRNYLFYFLITDQLQDQISPLIRGAQYPAISDKDLLSCGLRLPDLSTQTRIVSQLDDLSQNIASLRSQYTTQLQHFDDLRASILDQAFKGELVEG